MTFKVDVYTNPHKELRARMFELSIKTAAAVSKEAMEEVKVLAQALFAELEHHAHAEDTYVHPCVRPKMAAELMRLHSDHEEQDQELLALKGQLLQLSNKNISAHDLNAAVLQFYRHLNRFIGHYLLHLAEEESLLPLYQERCEPYELFAIMVAFKSQEEPLELPFIMNLANDNLSVDEIVAMFKVIRSRLGENVFLTSLALAKTMLAQEVVNQLHE